MKYPGLKPLFLAAPLLALVVSVVPSASWATSVSVRKELEGIYAKYVQLVKRNDREGLKQFLEKYTTKDFIQKLPDGRSLNRSQTISTLTEGALSSARFTEEQLSIVSVTPKGSRVVVVYKDRTTAILTGQDGQKHKMVTDNTSRDIWVKTAAGWQTKLSEVLKSDGKMAKAP